VGRTVEVTHVARGSARRHGLPQAFGTSIAEARDGLRVSVAVDPIEQRAVHPAEGIDGDRDQSTVHDLSGVETVRDDLLADARGREQVQDRGEVGLSLMPRAQRQQTVGGLRPGLAARALLLQQVYEAMNDQRLVGADAGQQQQRRRIPLVSVTALTLLLHQQHGKE